MYPILWFHGIPVKLYWLLQGIGIFIASFLFYKFIRRQNLLTSSKAIYFLIGTVISVIIGARLFYFLLSEPSYIFKHLTKVFSPYDIYWEGGVSSFGSILAAMLYAISFSRKNNISFWKLSDIATVPIAISLTFFRIGCFLNGCCYGKPTNLFWGVYYKSEYVLAPKGIALHPVQLYEALMTFVLFFIFLKRKPKFQGDNILTFAIYYNSLRFLLEFFKWTVPISNKIPLNYNQILALLFVLIALILKYFLINFHAKKKEAV